MERKRIFCGTASVIVAFSLFSGCSFHKHSYASSAVAPTCTDEGYTVFTCECGDSYRDTIVAAHGHNYESNVIDPSYAAQGYTLHRCRNCAHEYRDTFTQMPTDTFSSIAKQAYLSPVEEFSRPRVQNPEFVMIHFISAVVLSKEEPYSLKRIRNIFIGYGVSVHYVVDRNGTVYCYIPEELVAYHAGKGTWNDDPQYTNALNNYSIGIELVAMGSKNDMAQYMSAAEYDQLDPSLMGYTEAQYDSLKVLVQDICERNDIPMDRQHVIGHEEYSPHKSDPGELFDWARLIS